MAGPLWPAVARWECGTVTSSGTARVYPGRVHPGMYTSTSVYLGLGVHQTSTSVYLGLGLIDLGLSIPDPVSQRLESQITSK